VILTSNIPYRKQEMKVKAFEKAIPAFFPGIILFLGNILLF